MAGFVFKFERLLKLKEIEEKKETAVLSRIREELRVKKEELFSITDRIGKLSAEIEELEVFNIDTMKYYTLAMHELNMQEEKKLVEVKEVSEREKVQEKKVIELRKGRRTLEKLREKHRIQFMKEEEKKLNKFMDELAQQSFMKSSSLWACPGERKKIQGGSILY